MYRVLAASLLLAASTAASWAQGLSPSVWQSQQGAILKVLTADSASGNFGGIFISSPTGHVRQFPMIWPDTFKVPESYSRPLGHGRHTVA
jgi:hypothetical protein